MGVFSNIHRFREAGEDANVKNVEKFGLPQRSLFTTSKLISIRQHIDVTDGSENLVYYAETKFPSLHDKTEVYDAQGNHVAHFEKKIFTLHQRHFITMEDGTAFQLATEFWHFVKDITNIDGLGWQLRGNILGLNFELYDQNEEIIAVISQKMLSLHDKYCIDIYRPEYEQIVVTILLTLQHMIRDRQNAASSSSSSSSGSST